MNRIVESVQPGDAARLKHCQHPLARFIQNAYPGIWSTKEGMNWLQDRGWISDNCVTVEDVSPVDIERVLLAAKCKFDPDPWSSWNQWNRSRLSCMPPEVGVSGPMKAPIMP